MLRRSIILPTPLLATPLPIWHVRFQIIVIIPVERELVRRRAFARQVLIGLFRRVRERELIRPMLRQHGASFDVFRAAEDGACRRVKVAGEERRVD